MKSENNLRCHSGGAIGADSYFENLSEQYGIKTLAYSYKTAYHTSKNKIELTDNEFEEGALHISIANETLTKFKYKRYLKLLARCWFQVKNAEQIFAISTIVTHNNREFVKGGTGWAVQMAIDNKKPVFIFEQNLNSWFCWDYSKNTFVKMEETPIISTTDFAGIGARNIAQNGIQAVEDLFKKSFQY